MLTKNPAFPAFNYPMRNRKGNAYFLNCRRQILSQTLEVLPFPGVDTVSHPESLEQLL